MPTVLNRTFDGNNQSHIFNVCDNDDGFLDDVSIDGLTLANGNTGDGSLTEINGGAILNYENLFVTNTAFIGNRAGNGGAIFNIGQIQLDNSLVAESDGTVNGTDFIVDFNRGNNLLGLSASVSFADLSFSGNDIIFGDETLATLNGFDTTSLTKSNFISI